MLDVKKHPYVKYPLFGTLYFSQGIIWTLAMVIINIYLDKQGIADYIIGLVIALAYIPWIIKFVFGGIVDYFIRITRRNFIIFGGVVSSFSFIIVSFVEPSTNLILFSLLVFIGSCGIAFLDVSADAWAIELCEEKERGKINAAMFSGLFFGAAVSSIVMSLIADNYGYPLAFVASGLIILVIIVFPLLIKDTSVRIRKNKVKNLLIKEFKKKNTQMISLFFPFTFFSFGLLSVVLPQYMNDVLLFSQSTIGWIMAFGNISSVVGNVIGGFMADLWGRKNSLYVFIILSLVFSASLIFASTLQILIVLWFIVGLLHGGNYSVSGAIAMDITNPRVGASQYSILMAFGNIGEMGGAAFSGTFTTIIGFGRTFLYSGWFYGPGLLVLYYIKRTYDKTKRKKK